jgi:3-hydroxyisobutyrate dehydrogenase-like beta-hydroxyacid dehydrogenase
MTGFIDVGSIAALVNDADAIVSVCPPHAALDVAEAVAGFRGLYLDANAISPAHAKSISAIIDARGGRYVDGAILVASGRDPTRLFLSGECAREAEMLFEGADLDVRVISADPTLASALKMSQAAWNKGTQALIVAVRAFSRALGVDDELVAEYQQSAPQLVDTSLRSAAMASKRGWRWSGEMDEIAASFRAVGLPGGFHDAAGEIFSRAPRNDAASPDEANLRLVTDTLNGGTPSPL